LDVVNILSDEEECDPALLFWLVEELMDTQTIAGCRKIFDYLESRRERMIAKHFVAKKLAILRTCNELLRRLSRAEDTAFCGRVFIFMFQSFPLGDKSSVNLRGEYHVENVTTFDQIPVKKEDLVDQMEIDTEGKATPARPAADSKTAGKPSTNGDAKNASKSVSFNAKDAASEKALDPDELYPVFWSLQQSFSQPKGLFDHQHFINFKNGLDATMSMFRCVQNEANARGPSKNGEESNRGTKRKRGQDDDDLAHTFNPKYLTSRDLFELEIKDLSFRRSILVQALIIMDFLISLGSKAKEKLSTITKQNLSVVYQDQTLSDEDIKWAMDTKRSIADYLKEGYDGAFFYRMVDSVLSRDKHWVRWKVEGCPSIELPAIKPEEYLSAKATAKKATTNKRLRPKPMGSLDLAFLSEADGVTGMQRLKNPERYSLPALASFKNKIAEDDLEIDMPTSEETKEAAIYGKASKSWRALRIASKSKLAGFDKIDDPEKIDSIFETDPPAAEIEIEKDHHDETEHIKMETTQMPTDRRPIVISGPSGVGKGTLITMLMDKYPTIFGKKASHTTRAPREGEVDGSHYNFIDTETYAMMRDEDQFLEFNKFNGHDYGTSRKVVEGIIAAGKVPVMEMDYHVSSTIPNSHRPQSSLSPPPHVLNSNLTHPRESNSSKTNPTRRAFSSSPRPPRRSWSDVCAAAARTRTRRSRSVLRSRWRRRRWPRRLGSTTRRSSTTTSSRRLRSWSGIFLRSEVRLSRGMSRWARMERAMR
jgi:THO complex subunit 1